MIKNIWQRRKNIYFQALKLGNIRLTIYPLDWEWNYDPKHQIITVGPLTFSWQ